MLVEIDLTDAEDRERYEQRKKAPSEITNLITEQRLLDILRAGHKTITQIRQRNRQEYKRQMRIEVLLPYEDIQHTAASALPILQNRCRKKEPSYLSEFYHIRSLILCRIDRDVTAYGRDAELGLALDVRNDINIAGNSIGIVFVIACYGT